MDNTIHAEHRLRKVVAEKRPVCQTITENWKWGFSALLASVHRGQVRAGQFTYDHSALRQPRSIGDHRHWVVSWCRFSSCIAEKLSKACCRNIPHFCVSVSLQISPSTSHLNISASHHQAIGLKLTRWWMSIISRWNEVLLSPYSSLVRKDFIFSH